MSGRFDIKHIEEAEEKIIISSGGKTVFVMRRGIDGDGRWHLIPVTDSGDELPFVERDQYRHDIISSLDKMLYPLVHAIRNDNIDSLKHCLSFTPVESVEYLLGEEAKKRSDLALDDGQKALLLSLHQATRLESKIGHEPRKDSPSPL